MKKILTAVLAALVCLAALTPAMAANVFAFTEKSLELREGETRETALRVEGSYAGDGGIEYASSRPEVATVAENGAVTAVGKGQATITASLMRNGKRVGKAQMTVKVLRPVTKVTLDTSRLMVYDPEDPAVFDLLEEAAESKVIVLPAGAGVTLSTICTPEDASSKAVTYQTSDAGVARVNSARVLKAVQRGECDLTIASAQDPDVTETYHILVTQPVKKVQIEAPERKVAAGSKIRLTAVCSPEDATIKNMVWSSKNPACATVDDQGYVTGVKRGSATIVASAGDGSRAAASVTVTVTQPVTSLAFSQAEVPVVVGRTVQTKVTVYPNDASDKGLVFRSSDESVATVQAGRITGRRAGTCTVTCESRSNPEVTATIRVVVSQLVTKIECTTPVAERSLLVGETRQLSWAVLPEDATNKDLSFKSGHSKVATVDANGYVTGVGRGTAYIIASARDGSRRQGSVKVTVIQPVTGVKMHQNVYYVQRGGSVNVRAVVQPRNANNQRVAWYSSDERIATVRSNGTSTGRVYGVNTGWTTITGVTDDGGFSASARIRVDAFNEAVMIEELYVNSRNEIKISIRNMSSDITLETVYFRIDCFDNLGNPMIVNKDGKSTYFEGSYPYTLYPSDRSVHGAFRFKDYAGGMQLGAVRMTITGWTDSEGYTWTIPESERITTQWASFPFYDVPD